MFHLFGGLRIDLTIGFVAGLIAGILFYVYGHDANEKNREPHPPPATSTAAIPQAPPATANCYVADAR